MTHILSACRTGKAGVLLTTTATSALASFKVGRMTVTTTAVNSVSHAPIAGLSITITIKSLVATVTCTATTNTSGIATCASGNGKLLLIKYPATYTATSPATVDYVAGSAAGTITVR